MKRYYQFALAIAIIFALAMSISHLAFAQKVNVDEGPIPEKDWMLKVPGGELSEDHAKNKNWITHWYGPDGNYENNGGFQASAPKDLIDEGTGGKLDQISLSTIEGLRLTQSVDIEWKGANGGAREWTVFELDPANTNNMTRDGPADNIDTYGIVVVDAPEDMEAVMSPAHDDHAQIWINGEKWYNNPTWTGHVQQVDYNIQIDLQKGGNVILYRVGESGGDDYINLHFDDNTHKVCEIYPDKSDDQASFFSEVARALAIDPVGKATTTWADIKRNR